MLFGTLALGEGEIVLQLRGVLLQSFSTASFDFGGAFKTLLCECLKAPLKDKKVFTKLQKVRYYLPTKNGLKRARNSRQRSYTTRSFSDVFPKHLKSLYLACLWPK